MKQLRRAFPVATDRYPNTKEVRNLGARVHVSTTGCREHEEFERRPVARVKEKRSVPREIQSPRNKFTRKVRRVKVKGPGGAGEMAAKKVNVATC